MVVVVAVVAPLGRLRWQRVGVLLAAAPAAPAPLPGSPLSAPRPSSFLSPCRAPSCPPPPPPHTHTHTVCGSHMGGAHRAAAAHV